MNARSSSKDAAPKATARPDKPNDVAPKGAASEADQAAASTGQATSQAPVAPGDNSGGAAAQPNVVDRPGVDQVDEAAVAGVAAPNSDAQVTRRVRANANVLGHVYGDEWDAPDDAELSGVLAAGLVTDVDAEKAAAKDHGPKGDA